MARTKLYWTELAKRLTLERAQRGWTAEYVAERARIGSKDTVLKAETGERKPNNATIYKLEQAYGLTPGTLINLAVFGDDDSDPIPDELLARYGRVWLLRNRGEALQMLMREINRGAEGQAGSE